MAKFLTTKGTSYHLEQIIKNAKKELVLVSPYLSISKNLLERLHDAEDRGVEMTLIYGKEKDKPEETQKLQDMQRLSLYYHQELHAKCFYNENELIITSMNLHQFSEKTNREMGVLLKKDEDSNIYDEAVGEVQSILSSAEEIKLRSPSGLAAAGKAVLGLVGAFADSITGVPNKGYCIKCAQVIELDSKRPYCAECYIKWAEYKKRTYPEKFCHQCGKANKSSMAQPLCRACYEKRR